MKKTFIKKDKRPVVVKLVDGEITAGFVYLQVGERLVDMMNDERQFLPFEADDRDMFVINKVSISKIKLGY
jgi:hypothetical protein